MERRSDPNLPPAYALNTLHAAGYEPYAVDDGPPMYRLPGDEPKTWRECMEEVGSDNARLREDNRIMAASLGASRVQLMRVSAENHHLRQKQRSRFGELLLTLGTAVPVSAFAVGAVVFEGASSVMPQPYSHIASAVAAALAAKIAQGYVQNKPKELPEGKKEEP